MDYATYLSAKKLFESYDLRVEDNTLTVDAAYTIKVGSDVRSERDSKLAATDHRMVADAPWNTAAWATYRQQLRDLPSQGGFPHNVTWPTEPSA